MERFVFVFLICIASSTSGSRIRPLAATGGAAFSHIFSANPSHIPSRPSGRVRSTALQHARAEFAAPQVGVRNVHTMRKHLGRAVRHPHRRAQDTDDPPVKVVSARKSGLALALDDGTRKSHSMAENSKFVAGFFKGISTKESFSQLVASLNFVYESMEASFDATTDDYVKALDYPELRRAAALQEDMAYYFGPSWASTVKPSPATQKYVERVLTVARDKPYLLIAHQYTRYLGDLFGGQMMGGMARSSLKLDDGLGTRFYEFNDIPDTKSFIEQWYSRLNELDLSDAQKQEIVDEANLVFTYNIEIFDELDGGARAALVGFWNVLRDAFKSKVLGMATS